MDTNLSSLLKLNKPIFGFCGYHEFPFIENFLKARCLLYNNFCVQLGVKLSNVLKKFFLSYMYMYGIILSLSKNF